MASVAYFDPGNWSVDLQAGSEYGYKLLFVILLAGLGAIVLQVLACRLGSVTGLDLASHCRILLHDHPRHPRLVRRLLLYPLYALCEIAIISTDLAELLGSAIALTMIFPKLPLWVGVILTSLDVLVILAVSDGKGRPARLFEGIIVLLVLTVLICFIVLIVKVDPQWPAVFHGFLPSKTLIRPGALYISIGILGATVMPHALFLGSSLATLDRISTAQPTLPSPSISGLSRFQKVSTYIRSLLTPVPGGEDGPDRQTRHEYRQNNTLSFVRSHLGHGMTDITMSLLGIAVPINSAILVLAGTVFFEAGDGSSDAGLFEVHDLIGAKLGKGAAFMFALSLLAAGQSASITATLSGQIVSEGFLEWKVSPFVRRLVTRLIGLIPSALVAALVGRSGIDALLIASQVVLSIVLPFVIFPLVYLTSSHVVMRVKEEEINYRNNKFVMGLGYMIFSLVVVANSYVLVTLMRGN
ncbi:smf Mn2+ and Fe2+ transporter [Hysterangium stoloniferum]|nr:smf Mn2+ and Fe2+ transporter [Hysterangium stoloniferum]KAF8518496.1 smf Mn2+ and Fe2+ transporter [Hysterangium stoloniferum]KAF8519970.1 smf Mn2+ and Fe2+ transporter [Hysterangium stoloniferum]